MLVIFQFLLENLLQTGVAVVLLLHSQLMFNRFHVISLLKGLDRLLMEGLDGEVGPAGAQHIAQKPMH